jgi:RHS repeat-associated protein
MVASIVQGATNMSYAYDSEHARITQTEVNGANTTTTTYLNDSASGLSSEKVVAGATTTWTDYLFAGGARVAQRSMVVGGATSLRYFITDHLGSIAIITDGGGAVLERLAYDAWGKRRNTNGTDDPAGAVTSSTTRGFTDHEHIASVGLVNMNGRVYDPELGRFLSADPIVQSLRYSQFLNRYSYCSNEPTVCVDPSGNFGFFGFVAIFSGIASLFTHNSIVHTIASIAIGAVFGPFGGALEGVNNAVRALIGGFIAGGVTGHNIQSALFSGLQAFAFAGVGLIKENVLGIIDGAPQTLLQRVESAGLHALVGGLVSDAGGGKFGAGFVAAGFSDFASGYVNLGSAGANTVAIAIIGGASAKLAGGKFENGAVTAAFAYMYNSLHLKERIDQVMEIINPLMGKDFPELGDEVWNDLRARLPKWVRTVFGGGGGSVGAGGVVTGSTGWWWDRKTGQIGNFYTGGLGYGVEASYGVFVGFFTGTFDKLAGVALVGEVDTKFGSVTVLTGFDTVFLPYSAFPMNIPNGTWGAALGYGRGRGRAAEVTVTVISECRLNCGE